MPVKSLEMIFTGVISVRNSAGGRYSAGVFRHNRGTITVTVAGEDSSVAVPLCFVWSVSSVSRPAQAISM